VRALVALLVACLPGLAGCFFANPGPIVSVDWRPPATSPDLRDPRNRLDVRYRLNGAAEVSSHIQSADGQQWQIHSGAWRPRGGEYVLQFDGTVAGPDRNERRVLPDGNYQIVLDAAAGGARQQVDVPLDIRDADTRLPDVTDLAVTPDLISPDFDARNDETSVTFNLGKAAETQLVLDRQFPDGQLDRAWWGEKTDANPGEQRLMWDGLANGIPVPEGSYRLGVRAEDEAGNVVERTLPLAVEESGLPSASIVTARIGPRQIIRGDQVCVETVVRNTGDTTLRTGGPDPGHVYTSNETYSSIAGQQFAEQAGIWRVGLNWSGSTETTGATYPYRWGFGQDLQPGDEVSVRGCVVVLNQQENLVYSAGLVQEYVAIHSAGAGLVRIDISS
jgi:hypothetical protein